LRHPLPLGPGERWAGLATLCYALTNTFLRATIDPAHPPDPVVAAIVRLLPVTALAWTLTFVTRGKATLRPGSARFAGWRVLAAILLSGAASYFIGNSAYQSALNQGGVNVTIPVAQSASLWSGILLGGAFLGEHFDLRVAWGGLAVMIGLVLITTGRAFDPRPDWYLAIPFGAVAGASYATANLFMRSAYRRGVAQSSGLALNTLSGLTLLLATAIARDGIAFIARLTPSALATLFVASIFNAGALFSLSRALTLTTAGRVNTGSLAISTLLAALLFNELMTPPIALGIALIVGGVLLVQRFLHPASPQTA